MSENRYHRHGLTSSLLLGPGISVLSSEAERLAMKTYFRNVPEIYHKPMPLVASKIPGANCSSPPDGHTIWLAYKPTLERILGSSPVFKPIPKPKYSKAPFAVKASANKGLGLFATRNIGAGELLFSERPLLVVPSSNAGIAVTHYARVKDLDVEDQLKFGVEEWETHLQRAVNAMLPENKEEFMKLANQHTQDGSGPIFGIVRTNGYGIGPEFYDGDKVLPNQTNTYSAIAKLGSRINHRSVIKSLDIRTPADVLSYPQLHTERPLRLLDLIFFFRIQDFVRHQSGRGATPYVCRDSRPCC